MDIAFGRIRVEFGTLPIFNIGSVVHSVILFFMSRIARIIAPGYPHHITQRGNNHATVFFDDEDRQTYLNQVHAAMKIEDLRLPPSNHLEKLTGDRNDKWSIRINGQWRVCFRFEGGHAFDVEIVDYH